MVASPATNPRRSICRPSFSIHLPSRSFNFPRAHSDALSKSASHRQIAIITWKDHRLNPFGKRFIDDFMQIADILPSELSRDVDRTKQRWQRLRLAFGRIHFARSDITPIRMDENLR